MILARPFCSIDLCDLVFYQCVFVFCLITAALLALCFSHSVTGRGEKNLCNVHVLSHSYWRHTWIDRKGSGTTAVWNRCADDRQHETKRMNAFCSGDGNGRNGAAGQGGL